MGGSAQSAAWCAATAPLTLTLALTLTLTPTPALPLTLALALALATALARTLTRFPTTLFTVGLTSVFGIKRSSNP